MIKDEYSEVWDTCCDHGKLGVALLERGSVSKVHFLDCVPSIIEALELKLARRNFEKSRYQLHCMKAEDLALSSKGSLVCICGVGGETAIEILKGLERNNDLSSHEIIICVQHHIYQLREFLRQEGFKSKNETLVFDKGIGYEVFLLNKTSKEDVHPVGTSIFNVANPEHQAYLKKIIEHYKRKVRGDKTDIHIMNLYKDIAKK